MRKLVATAIAGLLAISSLGACGGDDDQDRGAEAQAVEQLQAYGLTEDQARCVVDQVGADAIVEAADLNAYAESEQYQVAATACTDG